MGAAFVRYYGEEARGVRLGQALGHAAATGMVVLEAIASGKLSVRFWKPIVRHGSSPSRPKPALKRR